MDKKIITVLFFIIHHYYFSQSNTSKIDSLGTISEVESFIRSCSKSKDDFLSEFTLKTIKDFDNEIISQKIKKKAKILGVNKSFYKGDFNHDGRTDLLFIGDNKSCIQTSMDSEKETSCNTSVKVIFDLASGYVLQDVMRRHRDFTIPKVIKIGGMDYINIYYEDNSMFSNTPEKMLSKILTYKFDDFIEYNPQPKKYSIKQISYEAGPCYGTCPMFKLELNKNKISTFTALAFNFIDDNDPEAAANAIGNLNKGKNEGIFKSQIKPSDFAAIEELLNYIDFPNLNDSYSISATDNPSSTLTIVYNTGKIKKIQDYGLVGTYGLKNLYKILFNLRLNQEWKKVE
ncbi:hypothetical protein H5J24_16650 [Chryseobacterium capnotolerans]|uniref:DUF6438 domain-containing protein n=1 Tax=Chryseobacterium TaxID=59732 RepID=UPI00083B5A21|nr:MULTISPECIES: DUF6438 domain-containing protein [Chryseobacterium]UHO37347.1 hypothetical protein H5J24_16650 [Chryseobacterium capnotolerans]